jgi:hypothetical protein
MSTLSHASDCASPCAMLLLSPGHVLCCYETLGPVEISWQILAGWVLAAGPSQASLGCGFGVIFVLHRFVVTVQ